jgi:hypothetical protein
MSYAARSSAPELLSNRGWDPVSVVITLATVLTFSVVGAMVASRHPRNTIGWLFCSTGLVMGLNSFAGGEQRQQIKWLAYGGAVVVGTIFVGVLISIWSVFVSIAIIAIALLVLPIFTGIAVVASSRDGPRRAGRMAAVMYTAACEVIV